MDTLALEIQRLKEELDRKRDEIVDLRKLVNEDIDRKFPVSAEEFSDRELEIHLRESLAALEGREETKPDLKAVLSHRRTLRKPVEFLKRGLLQTTFESLNDFLDKQNEFNRRISTFSQALLIRLRHDRERIKGIEEKITDCEESLALLTNKLEDLRSNLDRIR
jgi:hypothetical protein